MWVYRSEVEQVMPASEGTAVEPGSLVTVLDGRGIPLGSALFSAASQITLRMVSGVAGLTREAYLADVAARVAAALALREQLAPVSATDNAHRLIFSEADELPGIVADRYNDVVILQMLTQGTAREDVRQTVTRVLRERLAPATVVERPDAQHPRRRGSSACVL